MKKIWIYMILIILGLLTMVGATVLDDPQGLKVAGAFIIGAGLVFMFWDLMEGE